MYQLQILPQRELQQTIDSTEILICNTLMKVILKEIPIKGVIVNLNLVAQLTYLLKTYIKSQFNRLQTIPIPSFGYKTKDNKTLCLGEEVLYLHREEASQISYHNRCNQRIGRYNLVSTFLRKTRLQP